MKVKKFILLLVFMMVFAVAGVCGCGGRDITDETSVSETPVVTISQTSATMDLYDELVLTAEAQNTSESIVWSSSEPTVVSVDAGRVKALKEGSAVVTAKAGGAEASCSITVTNSHTAPVLSLSHESVAVAKDETFDIVIQTLWKGEPINEKVEYTWTLGEGEPEGIATVTSTDTGATVTGVAYGETTYYVSANVRGCQLIKKVSIKVCNVDVTFETETLQTGVSGFVANVALLDIGDHHTVLNAGIVVKEKGEVVADPEITYTVENEGIATIENGAITAVSEGTTTITGTYSNTNFVINVNVYRPEVTLEEKIVVEAVKNGEFTCTSTIAGEIEAIVIGENNVLKSVEDGVITLDPEKFPTAIEDMGEQDIVIDTNKAKYISHGAFYTKLLRTADDVMSWNDVAFAADEATNYWSGYFALAGDIDMSGKTYSGKFQYSSMHTDGKPNPEYEGLAWWNGRESGFRGVFDGCGYTIDNLTISGVSASFVGLLAKEGVVKNTAFTNLTLDAYTALISPHGDGRIENVYVHVKSIAKGSGNDPTGVFITNTSMGETRVVKCFVAFDDGQDLAFGSDFVAMGAFHFGYGVINGVYGVGLPSGHSIKGLSGTPAQDDVYGMYPTYAELIADVDFAAWENEFWKVVNGIPYPQKAELPEGKVPAVSAVEYTSANNTYSITGMSKADIIALDDDSAALGVTLTGNTVNVPADVPNGTTIKVIVSSIFDSEKKTVLSTHVMDSLTVNVSETVRVQIKDNENFTVDLSSYNVKGEVNSAIVGDASFAVKSFENGILTLDTATINGHWDAQTIEVVFVKTNNAGIIESLTTVMIKADVATIFISDKAGVDAILPYAISIASGESWKGHYVLTQDIEYNAVYTNTGTDYGWNSTQGKGFSGTIDGRGYSIIGLQIAARGGFIPSLAREGVIKNISFLNAKNTSNGGFLTGANGGTVQDVFISIDQQAAGTSWNQAAAVLCHDVFGQTRFYRVVVEYLNVLPANATTGYAFWACHYKFGILNGVFAIGTEKLMQQPGETGGSTTPDVIGAYANYAAFKEDLKTISIEWKGFWQVVDGIPVPAHLVALGAAPVIGNTELEVTEKSEIKLLCSDPYTVFAINDEAIAAGITLNGKTINVPAATANTALTVTATSLASGKATILSFTIVPPPTANVSIEIKGQKYGEATSYDITEGTATLVNGILGNQTLTYTAGAWTASGIPVGTYTLVVANHVAAEVVVTLSGAAETTYTLAYEYMVCATPNANSAAHNFSRVNEGIVYVDQEVGGSGWLTAVTKDELEGDVYIELIAKTSNTDGTRQQAVFMLIDGKCYTVKLLEWNGNWYFKWDGELWAGCNYAFGSSAGDITYSGAYTQIKTKLNGDGLKIALVRKGNTLYALVDGIIPNGSVLQPIFNLPASAEGKGTKVGISVYGPKVNKEFQYAVGNAFNVLGSVIGVNTPDNGTVSVSPAKAYLKDTVTVTFAPAAGYVIDTATLDGADISAAISGGVYTFVAEKTNYDLVVTYKEKKTADVSITIKGQKYGEDTCYDITEGTVTLVSGVLGDKVLTYKAGAWTASDIPVGTYMLTVEGHVPTEVIVAASGSDADTYTVAYAYMVCASDKNVGAYDFSKVNDGVVSVTSDIAWFNIMTKDEFEGDAYIEFIAKDSNTLGNRQQNVFVVVDGKCYIIRLLKWQDNWFFKWEADIGEVSYPVASPSGDIIHSASYAPISTKLYGDGLKIALARKDNKLYALVDGVLLLSAWGRSPVLELPAEAAGKGIRVGISVYNPKANKEFRYTAGSNVADVLGTTINVNTPENGTITVSPAQVYMGDTVTVTFTPAAGYMIDTVTLDGADISASVNGGVYTFAPERASYSVSVSYKVKQVGDVSLTVNGHKYGENGNAIAPDATVMLVNGSLGNRTLAYNDGAWTASDVPVGAYTLTVAGYKTATVNVTSSGAEQSVYTLEYDLFGFSCGWSVETHDFSQQNDGVMKVTPGHGGWMNTITKDEYGEVYIETTCKAGTCGTEGEGVQVCINGTYYALRLQKDRNSDTWYFRWVYSPGVNSAVGDNPIEIANSSQEGYGWISEKLNSDEGLKIAFVYKNGALYALIDGQYLVNSSKWGNLSGNAKVGLAIHATDPSYDYKFTILSGADVDAKLNDLGVTLN